MGPACAKGGVLCTLRFVGVGGVGVGGMKRPFRSLENLVFLVGVGGEY